MTCLVDFAPEQPEINVGATRGHFMKALDAAGLRLPEEQEDRLYWNGAMLGMLASYELLSLELPKRALAKLAFCADIRQLAIEPFPTVEMPVEGLRLVGRLLGDLAATLIAAGVRMQLPRGQPRITPRQVMVPTGGSFA